MRFKNRYILVEFIGSDSNVLTAHDIRHELLMVVGDMHGDYGVSCILNSLSIKVGVSKLYVSNSFYRSTMSTQMWRSSELANKPRTFYERRFLSSKRYCFCGLSPKLDRIFKIGKCSVVLKTLFCGATIRACEKRLFLHYKKQMLVANSESAVK